MAMLGSIEEAVAQALEKLVGLELECTTRAADMRGFGFGEERMIPDERRPGEKRPVSEVVLHIQCAWRIDGPDGILTGRADFWDPVDELTGPDFERWDNDRDANLQDHRIATWLKVPAGNFMERAMPGTWPRVEAVRATGMGGAQLDFSDGMRLTLFPHGSRGEDWRIFSPGDDSSHFVIAAGRVEEQD